MKKRSVGIRFKLIVIFIILIALPLVALGQNAYSKSVDLTQKELEQSSFQLIKQLNVSISNYLNGIENFIQFMPNEDSIKELYENPDTLKVVMKKFEDFKKSREDILSVYIGTKDKKMYDYPPTEKEDGFDPTVRPWYIEAKNKNKLVWTQPYKDNSTKKMVISVAVPVRNKKNEFIGVLAADIALDTLGEMINETKIGQKGYPFVVDATGKIIFHKDETHVGQPLATQAIETAMETKKEGIVNYSWKENKEIHKKFAVFSTLDKLGWNILGSMYIDELEEKTDIILKTTLIVGGIALLIAIFIAYIFSTSLTNPIKTLVHDMEKVSEGDFSIRRKVKRRDEIGQLGENFNRMVEDLGKLVKKVQEASTEVTSSAQNLAATSELTSSAAEEVSATIESIAKGATDQATEAEKGANLTLGLAEKFNQLTIEFNYITKSAEEVMQTSEVSKGVVHELKEKTELNNEGTEKIEEAIFDLDNRIKDISNILTTIDAIADQTNLLALNASIEAARAGDAGRGFTVVAEQIRKLAEESRISSDEIKGIIQNVQDESSNTVQLMGEVKGRTIGQNQAVTDVDQSFDSISNAVHRITEKIEDISDFANQINEEKDLIVNAIENISAVSEETAASSEEVTASMEQQVMAVEEIAAAADKLDELAMGLNRDVEKFRI
ncbi:methyl-accepting chemotaxis protein [Crassaminicella profunda]|uniref:methyl-accepting chemotaxis protein n=1 Tax=Crassaminicella profunda TaxID=1286698 RepID=UPI001CA6402B|nr:methyl-accepting chemotaxis protein [Crassaminicella profunda]QZY54825.1 methyl-accepting chemotaxis protein [Crassaminicella profunda]